MSDYEVRIATEADGRYAAAASALIAEAARKHAIAERDPAMLLDKMRRGRAVVALDGDRLVGFGYFAQWQGGRYVSHSGLVVDEAYRGRGLGRRIKALLIQASDQQLPEAEVISLTTSKAVEAMNLSFGFEHCAYDDLTTDPAFWAGCRTCRNYEQVQRDGKRCCCFAMIRRKHAAPEGTA